MGNRQQLDISRKFGKSGNRLEKVEERRKELKTIEKLSMTEIHKLADLALKVISVKVKHYAGLMNVQYGRITIRNQKTRWGSCSSKGNLNFNSEATCSHHGHEHHGNCGEGGCGEHGCH